MWQLNAMNLIESRVRSQLYNDCDLLQAGLQHRFRDV